jgi:hypothetical protein
MSYVVVERPLHGRLNEYTTLSDFVTYTPNEGFSGTDFFTYRMQLGAISTAPATAAIVVDDDDYCTEGGHGKGPEGEVDEDDDEQDIEQGGGGRPSDKWSRSRKCDGKGRKHIDTFEIEGDVEEQRWRPLKTIGSRCSGNENEGAAFGESSKRPASGTHTPFLQGLMKKMSLNGRDCPKPHHQQQSNDTSVVDEEARNE